MAYVSLGQPPPVPQEQEKKASVFWAAVVGAGVLALIYLLRQDAKER